jgi:hypothetical protein
LAPAAMMRARLVLGGEEAGALQRDVDAELLPRQLGGIALGGHLHEAAADIHLVALGLHLAGEAAMHGVVAEEMRVGLDRAEIVEAEDLDVLAAALDDGAQDQAADAAETVDGDFDCHLLPLLLLTTATPSRVRRSPQR